MKKESFVNKISIYIGVTLVLLIWLLTAYTVSSFLLLKESEESSVWSTIQIYMKQIDSKFIAMDQCVEGIAGNQDLIGQICYGSPAEPVLCGCGASKEHEKRCDQQCGAGLRSDRRVLK